MAIVTRSNTFIPTPSVMLKNTGAAPTTGLAFDFFTPIQINVSSRKAGQWNSHWQWKPEFDKGHNNMAHMVYDIQLIWYMPYSSCGICHIAHIAYAMIAHMAYAI